MTDRTEPEPSTPTAPTAPTEPVREAGPAPFPAPFPAPAPPRAQADATPAPAANRPWYRHVWVPVAGALVLALLAFGSGFVAGQAASLFRAVTVASDGGPAWGDDDGRGDDGPPGWRDGGPGQHEGGMPGLPGQRGDDGDTDTE